MQTKFVQLLSFLFPNLFTKVAWNKLTNPQVSKLRDREFELLQEAKQSDLDFNGFTIKLYEWAGEGESILLIHGWEGQAGNFVDLVQKLQVEGFKVYAFDAPSHGYSSRGKTSLFEFTRLVELLIQKYQVKKLISHSFGGVATTYALFKNQDLEIDKYALITTPDKFSERMQDVSTQYGISQRVISRLVDKFEADYGLSVDVLNVSNFVREINVKEAFIIHDKNDRVIPIERSKNVHNNWDECTFETIEGTGHFRILRDERVANKVIEFIK